MYTGTLVHWYTGTKISDEWREIPFRVILCCFVVPVFFWEEITTKSH